MLCDLSHLAKNYQFLSLLYSFMSFQTKRISLYHINLLNCQRQLVAAVSMMMIFCVLINHQLHIRTYSSPLIFFALQDFNSGIFSNKIFEFPHFVHIICSSNLSLIKKRALCSAATLTSYRKNYILHMATVYSSFKTV